MKDENDNIPLFTAVEELYLWSLLGMLIGYQLFL